MSPPYGLHTRDGTTFTRCTSCGYEMIRDEIVGVDMAAVLRARPFLCAVCYSERSGMGQIKVRFRKDGMRF